MLRKQKSLMLAVCSMASVVGNAWGATGHPRILVTQEDREAIITKIKEVPWAGASYGELKARVDAYLPRVEKDPAWLTSRLAMNWKTKFTTPVCEKSKFVRGEGQAPIPTPRFAGARDWASEYVAPGNLEAVMPYCDDERGRIYFENKDSQKMEWVEPSRTGMGIEILNRKIMALAADSGFVYYITGDERYAKLAADIVWTYMEGFSYVTPPKLPEGDTSMSGIIGMTSFEVIHEDIVAQISQAYDYTAAYLQKQGRDPKIVQLGIKRMIQRVVDGGNAEGNWNLNQARQIAYGGLVLEDDASYADNKGRQYYVDIVLTADLPKQRGLTLVMKTMIEPESALWPEASGYGFGAIGDVVKLASLCSADPAGQKVLANPLLVRAAMAPAHMIYPNGLSNAVGDTTNTRVNTTALELMIADTRRRGAIEEEKKMTAVLQREIDAGRYDRSKDADVIALTRFVPELMKTNAKMDMPRTFYGKPMNIVMQRMDGKSPFDSLGAALYGTAGGHIHANGMAIELYGKGLILGADPGRGSSYWQKDHAEYYLQPPAHNTVIVNGKSSYGIKTPIAMDIQAIEPGFGSSGVSESFGFATGRFEYNKPKAQQERTLALVKLGDAGFYVDIFRSRDTSHPAREYHDYLYHNIGQKLDINAILGVSSELTSAKGNLKGYDYFANERSTKQSGTLNATWSAEVKGRDVTRMAMWVAEAQGNRTVFAVDAPQNRAIRSELPAEYSTISMPTVVLRQEGEAWDRPFMVVYEPYMGNAAHVQQVKRLDGTGTGIEVVTDNGTVIVLQSDERKKEVCSGGVTMRSTVGAVVRKNGHLSEVYLGDGGFMSVEGVTIKQSGSNAISVSVKKNENGWTVKSTGPAQVQVPDGGSVEVDGSREVLVKE